MNFDADHILVSPFTIGGLGSLVALKFAPGASLVGVGHHEHAVHDQRGHDARGVGVVLLEDRFGGLR